MVESQLSRFVNPPHESASARFGISADPAIGQGAEVGLAAAPSVGGSFLGLAAKVLFDPVHERNELVLNS